MTVDQVINVLVAVAVVVLMFAIGLGLSVAKVLAAAGNRRLLLGGFVANDLLVPAASVGLLLLFRAEPMVAAGFLIVAACPGAPYGPPLTAVARGDVAVAAGFMVMLAASSAIVVPLLLAGLLPLVSSGEPLRVNAARMALTLCAVQLFPMGAGLALRHWRPRLADRLLAPANRASVVLNISAIGLIVWVHFPMLAAIRPAGFLGMSALVLAALSAGWVLGGPGAANRRAMAITTSVRNVGVGLVIATSSFPGTAAVTATLAFGVFQTVVMGLVALGWGQLAPAAARGQRGDRRLRET